MGIITSFIMLTVDGFYEGRGGAFDFWTIDDEFNTFANAQLDDFDTLAFGRVTFEGMASYWSTLDATNDSPETAQRMNTMPKVVVSTTLTSSNWAPTTILAGADGIAEHSQRLNERVLVLGSPRLTGSLIQRGLLDELRIMVSPVAIGSGEPISERIGSVVQFQLGTVRPFASGNVLLTYRPETTPG